MSSAQGAQVDGSAAAAESRAVVSAAIKRLLNDQSWQEDLQSGKCDRTHFECLYEVLVDVQGRYGDNFTRMCQELQPKPTTAYQQFIGVSNNLFAEEINWGRIAALLAFCAHLARFCRDNGMGDMTPSVIAWLQRLADAKLLPWIVQHDGWVRARKSCLQYVVPRRWFTER